MPTRYVAKLAPANGAGALHDPAARPGWLAAARFRVDIEVRNSG
jgi:hypothetical protein